MIIMLAFLFTLGELLVVLAGYLLNSQAIFYGALLSFSPIYLVMNMFSGSVLWDKSPIYIAALGFHVLKYFILFRAQLQEEHNFQRYSAIFFEAVYLCLSAYFMNQAGW